MKTIKRLLNDKKRGVAILTVMVALALMMSIVTDLSTKETVRYKLAINERDSLQAEALAQSGANFAQLLLMVQEPLQGYLEKFAKMGVSLPAYTVWDLMPIDSDLLKGITDGSFMPDFMKGGGGKEDKSEKKVGDKAPKEADLVGPYKAPEGGYGGFRGRFSVLIEDEEKKISLRRWDKVPFSRRKMTFDLITKILLKPENDILFDGSTGDNKGIGARELVGNIYDYLSEDEMAVDINAPAQEWGRSTTGSKKSKYADMSGILPKSAPADSLSELRLVPGMTDAIFQVLSKNVTIYGESEKINILSASDDILGALFFMCAKEKESGPLLRPEFQTELIAEWNRKKTEGTLDLSVEGVMKLLEENRVEVDKKECESIVGTESKTFTVRSTATVGNVTRTLLMRVRSAGGITTLYQFQYL